LGHISEPVFLEDFSGFGFDMVVFIFSGGVEGELALGRASGFDHIHGESFEVLVDKEGILEGKVFPSHEPTEEEQRRTLRWLLYWFWRDLSEVSRALARSRLWTAYGLLEGLRLKCVNLARLKHHFSSAWVVGYEKLEQAADEQDLEALRATFCPLAGGHARSRWASSRVLPAHSPAPRHPAGDRIPGGSCGGGYRETSAKVRPALGYRDR
jgi:hypothetical protein